MAPASAIAAQPAPTYVAGSSVASKPVWDEATQSWYWKCTYAGWAHVQVNYDCHLNNLFGTTISRRTGEFSGGSYSTPGMYFRKDNDAYLCTIAYAAYNNGSDSDSDEACN
jgi:hypothetical protein